MDQKGLYHYYYYIAKQLQCNHKVQRKGIKNSEMLTTSFAGHQALIKQNYMN